VLQPLRWCCVDCVIHHERHVREEKHHKYMWREQAMIEWSWHVNSIVAFCHSVKLCAYAARDLRSQQLSFWCEFCACIFSRAKARLFKNRTSFLVSLFANFEYLGASCDLESSYGQARGVPRLDSAWGKKQVFLSLFKSDVIREISKIKMKFILDVNVLETLWCNLFSPAYAPNFLLVSGLKVDLLPFASHSYD